MSLNHTWLQSEIIGPVTGKVLLNQDNNLSASHFFKDISDLNNFPERYIWKRSMMNMYMLWKKFNQLQIDLWIHKLQKYYKDNYSSAMEIFLSSCEEQWESCPQWTIALVVFLENNKESNC